MNGIQFVTDEKGNRTAVLIDLKTHEEALQYFFDGLIAESRRSEPDVPFDDVVKDRAQSVL